MRSIIEICIAVSDGQPVTEEELRLTVASLSHMLHGLEREHQALTEAVLETKNSAKMRAEFAKREKERRFQARKMPPEEYLGKDFTPGTPENLALAKMARAVFKKATGQDL